MEVDPAAPPASTGPGVAEVALVDPVVATGGTDTAESEAEKGAESKRPRKEKKRRLHRIKRTGTLPEEVLRVVMPMLDLAQRFKIFRVSKLWRLCGRDQAHWLELSFRERPSMSMEQICKTLHWAFSCHHLDLTGCHQVSDLAVAKIGYRMHRLHTLILAGTAVHFSNPKLVGALKRLGQTLKHLDVSKCRLENLDMLQALNNLETINLKHAKFPSLLPLKAVAEKLQTIYLSASSCSWNQIIEVVSAATQLKGFHIDRVRNQEGAGFRYSPIRGLTSFSWEFMERTGETETVRFILEANSETLEILNIPADEAVLESLRTCTNLRRLRLQAPGFRRRRSGNGPLELLHLSHERLRELHLDGHFEFAPTILQQNPSVESLTVTQTRIPNIDQLLSTSYQLRVLKFSAVSFGDSSELTIEDQSNLEVLEIVACGSFETLAIHGCTNLRTVVVKYCTPLQNLRLRAPSMTKLDITGLHQLQSADLESDRLRQFECTRFPTYTDEIIRRLESQGNTAGRIKALWLIPTHPQPVEKVRSGELKQHSNGGHGRGGHKHTRRKPFAGQWRFWNGAEEKLFAPEAKRPRNEQSPAPADDRSPSVKPMDTAE
eukprot:TRINITY_DN6045_c0_g1_i1.p1 TRINITY_DN6045_c0_g1~~TRINITY_DN6045_c0_g1_i1.p1  ORF type:complete len:604 (-),score=95.37 TRINITY_DN6045_c0_g1_i1:198-2009(-)